MATINTRKRARAIYESEREQETTERSILLKMTCLQDNHFRMKLCRTYLIQKYYNIINYIFQRKVIKSQQLCPSLSSLTVEQAKRLQTIFHHRNFMQIL